MAGKAGDDYLPNDKCPRCGAVPWWNGRQYQIDHHPARHGVYETDVAGEGVDARHAARERRSGERAESFKLTAHPQPARRPVQDDDDD